MEKTFYTISEIIKTTGLGRTKIYEEINLGFLEAKKCGARTLISADAFKKWMDTLPNYRKSAE